MRIVIPLLLTVSVLSTGCASDCGTGRHRECLLVPAIGHAHVSAPTAGQCAEQPAEEACVPSEACPPCAAPVPKPEPTETVTEKRPSTSVPVERSNYGRAEDYSWLMGELHRVHVPGGEWKIRYAPLSASDRWGGSVVLAPDARLDRFSEGDFVYVDGEVLANRSSLYLTGALYRIRSIRRLNHSRLAEDVR